MAQKFDLIAEERTDSGKGASRRLRRAGKVPAIVYGAGREPRSVMFDRDPLMHKMENEAFFSSVLNVNVGGKSRQCILKDIHMHPAKRLVLHLDLQRIVADEKIRMDIPIHFLNEETAIGVKQSGGTVSHMLTEIEVSCLPANLPEYLEIDIEALDLDDSLSLSDLVLPDGVEIPELTAGNDQAIVSVHMIKVEVVEDEETDEEVAEGDVPAAGDEKAAEGEEAKGDDDS